MQTSSICIPHCHTAHRKPSASLRAWREIWRAGRLKKPRIDTVLDFACGCYDSILLKTIHLLDQPCKITKTCDCMLTKVLAKEGCLVEGYDGTSVGEECAGYRYSATP